MTGINAGSGDERFSRSVRSLPYRVVQETDYSASAARWRSGEPIPVLRCAELERFEGRARSTSSAGTGVDERRGVVVTLPGGAAGGRLLAEGTGREHVPLRSSELTEWLRRHDGGPVALVADAHDLSALDAWPGIEVARFGLVTAVDPAALSVLVLRTLLSRPVTLTAHAIADPQLAQQEAADAQGLTGLFAAPPDAGLLSITAHGRECCLVTGDGIVCGAAVTPPRASRTRVHGHAPSCLRGGGCFRRDLGADQRRSAQDLDAVVVFANACFAVSAGVNVNPAEVNLGLRFLSGSAVAVMGPMGAHVSHSADVRVLRQALSRGLDLGAALDELNQAGVRRRSGALGFFGLLGDPGLVPFTESPEEDPAAPDEAKIRIHATRPPPPPPSGAPVITERLLEMSLTSLPVEAVAAMSPPQEDSVDGGEDLQRRLMTATVGDVQGTFWDLLGDRASSFEVVRSRAVRCIVCERGLGTEMVLSHRQRAEATWKVLTCLRCGELEWTSDLSPEIHHDLERHWMGRLGTHAPMSATVVNGSGRGILVQAGFAVISGFNVDVPTRWTSERVVEAGEAIELAWEVDLTAPGAYGDEHRAMFLTFADGVATFSKVHLGVERNLGSRAR